MKELKFSKRKYSELLRKHDSDGSGEEIEKLKKELKFCKRKYSELRRKLDKNKDNQLNDIKNTIDNKDNKRVTFNTDPTNKKNQPPKVNNKREEGKDNKIIKNTSHDKENAKDHLAHQEVIMKAARELK